MGSKNIYFVGVKNIKNEATTTNADLHIKILVIL
jgi:hypothetical protein